MRGTRACGSKFHHKWRSIGIDKAEEVGAGESAIFAQIVDVPKSCEEAAMMAKEVAIVTTG